jgi:hypothetical protein
VSVFGLAIEAEAFPMPAIVVVNPTSGSPAPEGGLRVLLDGLAGRRIGFFSNHKPNAAAVLERVEEILRERFSVEPHRYQKTYPSLAAEPELLDRIARECEGVVVAGFD